MPLFVTATGVRITDGMLAPLLGVFWFTSPERGCVFLTTATARSAASLASVVTALYTVMYCVPARIRWTPASDASWPVVGLVLGLMPADFMAAIEPPAMSSFAP